MDTELTEFKLSEKAGRPLRLVEESKLIVAGKRMVDVVLDIQTPGHELDAKMMRAMGRIPTGTAAPALRAPPTLAALTAPDAVSIEEDSASLSDGEGDFEDESIANDSDLGPDSINDIKPRMGECFFLALSR
jgi:hypothetical protein